jgi:redox-sensing transcriptional repressor
MTLLPEKTLERLSRYRRLLLRYQYLEKPHIFSGDLANMLHINAAHVRRDLMLLGASGSRTHGYDVQQLIRLIAQKLHCAEATPACIIGFGHAGRFALELFGNETSPVTIAAIFDNSNKSIGKVFDQVPCYSMEHLAEIISQNNITLAILTDDEIDTDNLISLLISFGIKGIMNFTSNSLHLPEHIALQEFDFTTAMIKLAYFTKRKK